MSNHVAGRMAMLFLLGTAACAGVGKSTQEETSKQAEPPKQEASPTLARPDAALPSSMLMDLEPPPEALRKARSDEKQPLPEEQPPEARPGAKLPSMMLQDLEVPPGETKASPKGNKPMPLPEEEKPPR